LPGRNYLEFGTSEELIASATLLFENDELRREMMLNNRQYYKEYVRPDALVRNSLDIVLSKVACAPV
jgi:hypothetical protein